ncbi:galactokinase [Nocardioides thalensis]|uniref:Galactokinase n=1 Tax=Nocardioides thalensis TaxID=1914755 RepID=A0A853C7J0_9ACTN|nr:galactokinase [Nocardioides thalensis]
MSVRWRAPGRVNLIGEHTDYNAGLALPFALAQGCTATAATADGFAARSAQHGHTVEVDSLGELPDGWVRYVLGPAKVLRDRGHDVPPVRVEIDSDVPVGAGLSSSAAVVCSVTGALSDLLGLDLGADDLLAVSRAAENDVVGAPTGGLDQLASLRSRDGHVLLCDFADLSTEPVPFAPADHGLRVLVVDTRVEHGHVDGEYAARRTSCEEAARRLGVASLRDVTDPGTLDRLDDDVLRRRARHVVTENDRVRAVVDLLRRGDLAATGPLLSSSHASLRDDFEVTVPALDLAAETLVEAGAVGARMTGGGFGGCVIALVPDERVAAATSAVEVAFAAAGLGAPVAFTAHPSAGAHRLS